MYDLLIKNGDVVVGNAFENLNIGIKDNKITLLSTTNNYEASNIIDAKNLTILPGVIDSQVHFREPGSEHKEDLHTGSKGAALGGVTSVFEMPNTYPPTSTVERLKDKFELAKDRMWVNYAFYAGATPENFSFLPELEKVPGCVGVKIFMGSSTGNLLIPDDETLINVLKSRNFRVAVHAEDEPRLIERKKLIKSNDVHFHPIWRDELSALNATKRVIKGANASKKPVHILHITTEEEIEYIRQNKEYISVEVTPQHLTLSAPDCYDELGTFAQMNPPIRESRHQKGLWKGIKDGVVDVIGSDHAPHTIEEKHKPYPDTPSGMPGVQTLLPIMLDHVNNGNLSLFKLCQLISTNPAKLYKVINKGEIKLNNDADLTIIDLNKEVKIKDDMMANKSGWTPFNNKNVKGWPIMTIVNGNIVMRDGELIGKPIGKPVSFNRD
ncbi:MAG: dihydroorotase [Alphaproteobacteria bacterium]|nr:MAG: dihydroorotase [Alphaproteobacteria bacterium]|tara:strand:- start:108 stop:1424 length:1317 start_codon:yes stop_codon:yes gene_type:complete